jgi:hypothetical protein
MLPLQALQCLLLQRYDLVFCRAKFQLCTIKLSNNTALNLASDVTVTASGNFTISSGNYRFGTNLVLQLLTLIMDNTNCICEMRPIQLAFSGQINHEATNATTKTVSLTGIGINPKILMM